VFASVGSQKEKRKFFTFENGIYNKLEQWDHALKATFCRALINFVTIPYSLVSLYDPNYIIYKKMFNLPI